MALQPRGGTSAVAVELTVAAAGTAIGSDTKFTAAPVYLSVYADKDCWLAQTQAGTAVAGDGATSPARVFVAAGERRAELPWGGRGLWVLNANSAETPKVRAEGYS